MSMEHLKNDGGTFSQFAQGNGDLEVVGLIRILGDIRKGGNRIYKLAEVDGNRTHLGLC